MTYKNMVPCKMCAKNFNYIPGPAGNNRQICDTCKKTVDEAELKRIEEEMIKEGNRYLLSAPKRKNEYDPIEILVEGNLPDFTSDADRFICALEMGYFLRKQKGGFCGTEENAAKLMEHMGPTYTVLMMKQWPLPLMERAARHKAFANITKLIVSIASN